MGKIGVVDFQKFLEVSEAAKIARIEITEQGKQMERDLKNRDAEIEGIKKKIEREPLLMSKEQREGKKREIRIRINDLKVLQLKYREDSKALESQTFSRIQIEVEELLQGIGKEEDYAMIVDKRSGGVIYSLLSVDIADAGSVIAETDFEKIFDPFFSTKFTGRGLGLPVVLGIAQAHHGAVTVESELERGSIFRVFFPLSVEAGFRRPDITASPPEFRAEGTLLVVEDDETLAALRGLSPGIPFVLSSGYNEEQVMVGDYSELPQAFLGKPYRIEQLRDTIGRVLANKS